MIELLVKDYEEMEAMMLLTNLIGWLVTHIAKDEDKKGIILNGFVILRDDRLELTGLIVCDGNSQKRIIEILQQPPEAYKGKYIARIISEEPVLVKEESEDDKHKDDRQIPIKIEEG